MKMDELRKIVQMKGVGILFNKVFKLLLHNYTKKTLESAWQGNRRESLSSL